MKLINANTLELEEFFDSDIPSYAILSHTWRMKREEVSFQELRWLNEYDKHRSTNTSVVARMLQPWQDSADKAKALRLRPGYEKIVQSARLARAESLDYVWIDTCCIDQTSSAELSEAINSMFRWYEKSEVCFAFLSDVGRSVDQKSHSHTSATVAFEKSRWFTRGWTLQELLAPDTLMLYDRNWEKIGSKESEADRIASITGIPVEVLESGSSELKGVCVAQKMSWASKRKTSREEDIAYCLLGLFGINMPLLYGEGKRAFVRLQQEIIKDHVDHSLFAWGLDRPIASPMSIFARSPEYLEGAGAYKIEQTKSSSTLAFQLNNRGLEITLRMFCLPQVAPLSRPDWYYAILDVVVPSPNGDECYLCLPLYSPDARKTGVKDGDEMIRSPSGPVRIQKRHVPPAITRNKVVILRDAPEQQDEETCKLSISGFPIQQGEYARLVEVFPPSISQRDWVPRFLRHAGRDAYLLRFAVGNPNAQEPKRQVVVAIDTADATRNHSMLSTTTIDWLAHIQPKGEAGGSDARRAYASLADAVLSDSEMRQVQWWFQQPRCLAEGEVLEAEAIFDDDEDAEAYSGIHLSHPRRREVVVEEIEDTEDPMALTVASVPRREFRAVVEAVVNWWDGWRPRVFNTTKIVPVVASAQQAADEKVVGFDDHMNHQSYRDSMINEVDECYEAGQSYYEVYQNDEDDQNDEDHHPDFVIPVDFVVLITFLILMVFIIQIVFVILAEFVLVDFIILIVFVVLIKSTRTM